MKINPDAYKRYDDSLSPIMYLSGQKIKNENLLDVECTFLLIQPTTSPSFNCTKNFKKSPNSTCLKSATPLPPKQSNCSQVTYALSHSSLPFSSTNSSKSPSFHNDSSSSSNTTKTTSVLSKDNGNISKTKTKLKSMNKSTKKPSKMFINICKIYWDRVAKISILKKLNEN